MKWMLLLLLAFYGVFAIAAVPKVGRYLSPHNYHPSSNANSMSANVIQSKDQLVEIFKTNLKDANLLQQLIKDIRKFDDYSATYSHGVLPLLAELRSLIVRAGDDVFDVLKPVYGWCGTAKYLLEASLPLFQQNDYQSETARNDIIQSLLNDDFASTLSEKLEQLSNILNKASRVVSSISIQFHSDFTDQSPLFESTLRNELIKDKNERYTPELINNVVKSLVKCGNNTLQPMQELATVEGISELAKSIFSQKDEIVAFSQQQELQQQQQQYEHQQLQQQQLQQQQQYQHQQSQQQPQQLYQQPLIPATATLTIDPQLYMQYKKHVLSQFKQTRTFFKNFEHELEETISRVNEVKSKVRENNQLGQSLQMTGNTAAQQNQIWIAVQALKTKCDNFNATPF